VFLFDFRGSGESAKLGSVGEINARLRQTPFLEIGEKDWNVDEIVQYDVPAILDYVSAATGRDRVNWIGHSLGGMLMFPFLELSTDSWRIANFVAMGSTIDFYDVPQSAMLHANRSLRMLAGVASTGRLGRPLKYVRFPGLSQVDKFYYTVGNVDKRTVSRFYGYTLEDTGYGALRQLDPYLEYGHFVSADRAIDYTYRLNEVTTPILMVAGDVDIISDVPSTELTFQALGSPDKTMVRFGRREGHRADYGHCDLIWSRFAPFEVFPSLIDWLDQRQLGASPQSLPPLPPSPQSPRPGG
jgi:pimeloyl-ACP methyl ester carboxylesterase